MNSSIPSILSTDLYEVLGTAWAPIVIDVRSQDDFHAIDRLIPGAVDRRADDVQGWRMLEYGMVIYDALFSWCRSLHAESSMRPAASGREGRRG